MTHARMVPRAQESALRSLAPACQASKASTAKQVRWTLSQPATHGVIIEFVCRYR